MKALILNSGIGKRMGDITKQRPKCMTQIGAGFTIISWQLDVLKKAGIKQAVITTGPFAEELEEYVLSLDTGMDIEFVANPDYDSTNYIYSIYCAKDSLEDEIILLHGDLVFEPAVAQVIVGSKESCIVVDSTLPLPEKDFKARISASRVKEVSTKIFGEDCAACQPFYHIHKSDMLMWLDEIKLFCESGRRGVYAEEALNGITDRLELYAAQQSGRLCSEIDNEDDLKVISSRFKKMVRSERI